MKRVFFLTAAIAWVIASSAVSRTEAVGQRSAAQIGAAQTVVAATPGSHQAMLTTYCYSCHSTRLKTGGLALQGLNIQAAGADAEVWEKAVRKLRGRLMPPPGSPQPDQQDIDSFVAWMENELDRTPRAPKAGHGGLQRLSRTEYAAAVKALVGQPGKQFEIQQTRNMRRAADERGEPQIFDNDYESLMDAAGTARTYGMLLKRELPEWTTRADAWSRFFRGQTGIGLDQYGDRRKKQ